MRSPDITKIWWKLCGVHVIRDSIIFNPHVLVGHVVTARQHDKPFTGKKLFFFWRVLTCFNPKSRRNEFQMINTLSMQILQPPSLGQMWWRSYSHWPRSCSTKISTGMSWTNMHEAYPPGKDHIFHRWKRENHLPTTMFQILLLVLSRVIRSTWKLFMYKVTYRKGSPELKAQCHECQLTEHGNFFQKPAGTRMSGLTQNELVWDWHLWMNWETADISICQYTQSQRHKSHTVSLLHSIAL